MKPAPAARCCRLRLRCLDQPLDLLDRYPHQSERRNGRYQAANNAAEHARVHRPPIEPPRHHREHWNCQHQGGGHPERLHCFRA
jgi:hypothetical protein